MEIPELVSWEPGFAQDFEWTMLEAMRSIGRPDGHSAYFRLSTRPVDQSMARLPEDLTLLERRREHAVAGGYRISQHPASEDQVTLVGVGAMMTEVVNAAQKLKSLGLRAGVVCLTSPDLVFRSVQDRHRVQTGQRSAIAEVLFPHNAPAPLVTVLDGHPHTLAFLAGIRGDRTINLGVTSFGQASSVQEAYRLHGIDDNAIVRASLDLLGR